MLRLMKGTEPLFPEQAGREEEKREGRKRKKKRNGSERIIS